MDSVLTVAVVAAGVTKGVDFVRNLVRKYLPSWTAPKYLWNLLAFAGGVAAAYLIDAAGYVVTDGGPSTWATGLGIAGLASGWHEVFHFISAKAHVEASKHYTG